MINKVAESAGGEEREKAGEERRGERESRGRPFSLFLFSFSLFGRPFVSSLPLLLTLSLQDKLLFLSFFHSPVNFVMIKKSK